MPNGLLPGLVSHHFSVLTHPDVSFFTPAVLVLVLGLGRIASVGSSVRSFGLRLHCVTFGAVANSGRELSLVRGSRKCFAKEGRIGSRRWSEVWAGEMDLQVDVSTISVLYYK